MDGVRGYDAEFIGIYIMLLCRQAETHRIEKDLQKVSRWMGGIAIAKIENVIAEKFECDEHGFFNVVLVEVLEEVAKKSESARNSVNKRWEKIRTQYERNTNVSETYAKSDTKSILIKERKEKEIKVKEKKEKNAQNSDFAIAFPSFKDFWDLYGKKIDKEKSEKAWNKLSQSEKEEIMIYIPEYLKSQNDSKFIRHPTTFLNNRTWENELPKPKSNNQKLFNNEQELTDFLNVTPDPDRF
jgi:hypothetical protein